MNRNFTEKFCMSQSISQKFTDFIVKICITIHGYDDVMSCYTIVDGIFISDILAVRHSLRQILTYPVFNLLLAVGIMFATGGSTVVSKKTWGERKKEEAMEDFSFLTAVGWRSVYF